MTDELKVSIGDTNGSGRRQVILRNRGDEYSDTIDLASGWQRRQLLERALPAPGLSSDRIPTLDVELWQMASKKDQQATGEKERTVPHCQLQALDSEDYTASPIITEALFAGSPAVIGGMFKAGKTLMGMDAAISDCHRPPVPWRVDRARAARGGLLHWRRRAGSCPRVWPTHCSIKGNRPCRRDETSLVFFRAAAWKTYATSTPSPKSWTIPARKWPFSTT